MMNVGAVLHTTAGAWVHWMMPMAWQAVVLAAAIWAITRLTRKSSAAFRHALWVLLLIKLIVPPTLATPWSAATLAAGAIPGRIGTHSASFQFDETEIAVLGERATQRDAAGVAAPSMPPQSEASVVGVVEMALLVWAGVASLVFTACVVQYRRYLRRVARGVQPLPPELAERVARLAREFRVRERFDTGMSSEIRIPAVFGFRRPLMLLPRAMADELTCEQQDALIGHELAHIKRHDIQIGWGALALMSVYWFHPAVWLAGFNIRREREMACDDMVLHTTRQDSQAYASTLVRAAESFDGAVPAGAGFLGLLEVSDNLLNRMRSVLDARRTRRMTWRAAAAVMMVVAFLVPMGVWSSPSQAEPAKADAAGSPDVELEIQTSYAKADAEAQEYIRWTARQFGKSGLWLPENAFDSLPATEREQKITHIADALMGEYGRRLCESLAAAGPLKDKRLLPGLLKVAAYAREDQDYDCRPKWMAVAALGRLGDESAVPLLVTLVDHGNQNTRMWARASLARITGQNFGADKQAWGAWWNGAGKTPSIDLASLKPSDPIAKPAEEAAPAPEPRIVSSTPANGASDVDPALDSIQVTFDQDMAGGFSWTGGGPNYPQVTDKPHWIDKRTCALPVKLEGARLYRVGINSKSHKNFKSEAGVPVASRVIAFTTRGADPALAAKLQPPKAVILTPANGEKGVDPALDKLTVVFDQPMGGGFSWTGSGEHFPESTGKPEWNEERTACTMPVKLKPEWDYQFGLNSHSHNNFRSADGIPLEPIVWEFSTRK